MVRRETYEGDGPTGPGGAFKLLSFIGHSRHVSSGFVSFAIKTFTVSASSSVLFGLTSYMLFGKHLGPAMPFMGGAAFGFVGGLVHRYRSDVEEANLMVAKYPKIMEHHVSQVEIGELRHVEFSEWLKDVRTNFRKQGLLISALYSASETIDKLQEEEEERILDAHYRAAADAE